MREKPIPDFAEPALGLAEGETRGLNPGYRRDIAMSKKGSGLARLMGGLRNLDDSADVLATRLETALASMATEMATTTQIVGNVEQSVADLQAVNRLYSNGGPTLPSSVGSSAPSGT